MESRRDGTYHMLNNPRAGTYLKLDERDYYLWSLMDGSYSIKDLVVADFTKSGSIAFARVSDLVTQLRAASFLTDKPANIYSQIALRDEKRSPSYWVTSLWKAFLQKEMALNRIDGVLTKLYQRVFWVFFTKPALLTYPLLSAVGLGLFIFTVAERTYPLLRTGGDVVLGLLTFLLANAITVTVHESAHAFTTKHYGRRVNGGGLLVYFGSLAFFIDTMDMWMEPKRSRIAVSWAGPYSGLILGSVCMLVVAATGFDNTLLNAILFKIAFWAFVMGALMNMNPLLEWDAYFILMDWLEIPALRRRSMQFVRRNLVNKIVTRSPFSGEERIFAVFGTMALVYTMLVLGVVLYLWQTRVSGLLGLFGGWILWVLVAVIFIAVGTPVVLGLGIVLHRSLQWGYRWAYQNLFMGRPGNQVAALAITAISLAVPASFLGGSESQVYAAIAGALMLGVAVVLATRVAPSYLGSQLQWLFLSLPWLAALLLVASVLMPFDGADGSSGWGRPVANLLAHGVVPIVLLLSVVFLAPTLLSFTRTILQGAWSLLVIGVGCLLLGSAVAFGTSGEGWDTSVRTLDLLGYGLLAGALFLIHQRLRALRPEHPGGLVSEAISDAERLSSAMRFLVEGALEQFVQTHGRRALRTLEDQFNAASRLGSGVSLSITNGRVSYSGQAGLLERSQDYATALSRLLTINSRMAGRRFVEGQLRGLYRLMPWEEREIGDEHLFFRIDLMSGIHRAFSSTKSTNFDLLRGAPIFSGLADEDIRAISERVGTNTFSKGKEIIRQGDPGRTFFLVESGTVEVWVEDMDGVDFMVSELTKGDYFGERSLLNDAPRAATCRAKTKVSVLSLDAEDFEVLVSRSFQVGAEVDQAIQRVELLMTMPVFSEIATPRVQRITAMLTAESHPAGTTIIQQGDVGDKFYVVQSGVVEVRLKAEGEQEETTVGRLGRGEYFGEIALLMKVARTASVVAETDVELLALDNSAFDEMVKNYLQSSRGLEQVSSRRLIQLRRAESPGYRAAA